MELCPFRAVKFLVAEATMVSIKTASSETVCRDACGPDNPTPDQHLDDCFAVPRYPCESRLRSSASLPMATSYGTIPAAPPCPDDSRIEDGDYVPYEGMNMSLLLRRTGHGAVSQQLSTRRHTPQNRVETQQPSILAK